MSPQVLQLATDQHLRLPFATCAQAASWRLLCTRGRLWITQSCSARDHMLKAGDVLVLPANVEILVGALESAEFKLEWPGILPVQPVSPWRARLALFSRRLWQQPSSCATER